MLETINMTAESQQEVLSPSFQQNGLVKKIEDDHNRLDKIR